MFSPTKVALPHKDEVSDSSLEFEDPLLDADVFDLTVQLDSGTDTIGSQDEKAELSSVGAPVRALDRFEEHRLVDDAEFAITKICAREVLDEARGLEIASRYRTQVVKELISFLQDPTEAELLQPLLRRVRKRASGEYSDQQIIEQNVEFLIRTKRLLEMLPEVSVGQNTPQDRRDHLAESISIQEIVCGEEILFDQTRLVSAFIKSLEEGTTLSMHVDTQREYEELFSTNARLVVARAKEFQYWGIELRDLVSAGMQGLSKAIERYRPELGLKFATYAVNWIDAACRNEIADHSNTIRIPRDIYEAIPHIRRLSLQHRELLDAMPHKKQHAWFQAQLDLAANTVEQALKFMNSSIVSTDASPKGTDTPLGYDAFPEAVERQQPIETLATRDLVEKVQEVANQVLTSHQVELLQLSGILSGSDGSETQMPIKKLAELFGYSREQLKNRIDRADKILRRALRDELASLSEEYF